MSEHRQEHTHGTGAAKPTPRIVLVLGGGGLKGAVQLGVVRALDRLGIEVSEVIATSMGALVGAALAAGKPLAEQTRMFSELLEGGHVTGHQLRLLVNGPDRASVQQGRGYRQLLQRHFADLQMSQLDLPFFCNALSLSTGTTRYFGLEGSPPVSVADAVYASSCIPGVLEPLDLDGESYIDGGMAEPLGLKLAHARGPDLIIAVDLSRADHHVAAPRRTSPTEVLSRTYEILGDVLAEHALHRFGGSGDIVLIKPDLREFALREPGDLDAVIDVGDAEACRELAAHPWTRYLCPPDVVKDVDRKADVTRDHVRLDVDLEACINCGICAATCATEGFAAVSMGNVVRKLYHYECVRDAACERTCPTRAITLHHL